MLPAGFIAARYEVLRPVGAGAMSVVYEARDRDTGARLALKVLRPEHRLRPDLCARFVNEALPIRTLRHPALPRIFACEVPEDAPPYILMEFLGDSLAQRLAAGRMPAGQSVSICAQLAGALAEIHARGIVHRDLKPHNVLFAWQQRAQVKLVDFGLAKTGTQAGALPVSTAEDDGLGTPEYRAPEQGLSAKTVDGSADVYSLGVLLYELLSGAPPFVAESGGRLRLLHLMAPPRALDDPALPDGLWALCAAMLSKDRSQRPGAAAVAADLGRLAAGLPGKSG